MNALSQFPRVDTPITTSYGTGSIQKLDIFKNVVWIQYDDGSWEDRPLADVRDLLGQGTPSSGDGASGQPPETPKQKKSDRGSNQWSPKKE
jgi:hypothetical protein